MPSEPKEYHTEWLELQKFNNEIPRNTNNDYQVGTAQLKHILDWKSNDRLTKILTHD